MTMLAMANLRRTGGMRLARLMATTARTMPIVADCADDGTEDEQRILRFAVCGERCQQRERQQQAGRRARTGEHSDATSRTRRPTPVEMGRSIPGRRCGPWATCRCLAHVAAHPLAHVVIRLCTNSASTVANRASPQRVLHNRSAGYGLGVRRMLTDGRIPDWTQLGIGSSNTQSAA